MSGGDGSLLKKGPSPNCSDSDKEGTALSLRSSSRTQPSKRLQENSLKAEENGRQQRPNAFLNRGELIEVNKVRFYLVNLVFKPSKNFSIMRQDCKTREKFNFSQ